MTAEPVVETISPGTDEDGDGTPGTYVSASLNGTTGNHINASLVLTEPTDDDIADALVKTALAAAQLHSSGAWIALQQRLKEAP